MLRVCTLFLASFESLYNVKSNALKYTRPFLDITRKGTGNHPKLQYLATIYKNTILGYNM